MSRGPATVLFIVVALASRAARAQTPAARSEPDEDHHIVYEVGWAGSWSRPEGWHFGGATFAVEVTPVRDRLELEFGVTAIRAEGITETSVDLLFKKPWTISKRVEFMAGVGPELVHSSESGTFWGLSAVADLMVWPKRNVGWYVEPGYELDFVHGKRGGFAIAAGLIIGR